MAQMCDILFLCMARMACELLVSNLSKDRKNVVKEKNE